MSDSKPPVSGTRTRSGRLSRKVKEDVPLDTPKGVDSASDDEEEVVVVRRSGGSRAAAAAAAAALSAEEDSDYEPEAEQPRRTPAAKRTPGRKGGGRTPRSSRGRNANGGGGADLFEEDEDATGCVGTGGVKRDIYDFDAQSIISEDHRRTPATGQKRRGRPPAGGGAPSSGRRGAAADAAAAATDTAAVSASGTKSSWGSNIYSSIATALKSRADLDVYTSFLKSSVRNDELDSLYTEVCKPSNNHSNMFYGPSAALQSMMSRINNHDKIIDILRSLMARDLDGLVNRAAYLVPIVQQPLLSTEYLPQVGRHVGDPQLHVDCGYNLESDVNLLSGRFDLGYMSGGIQTVVVSDAFFQRLFTAIQSGEPDECRVLLALTGDNQLVAIALMRPDETSAVPYKLKKPIFEAQIDVDEQQPTQPPAQQPLPASATPAEAEASGRRAAEWLQQQADAIESAAASGAAHASAAGADAPAGSDATSPSHLRLLDAVVLKPNGKRDVLLLFTGRKPDGHIFCVIDEHRFMYQRFGFSKEVPISLENMVTAYPEDLLSEKSLLVVPDALFKSFKKLLAKSVTSAPASVSAKFVLLDKYKKTPLGVVMTANANLRVPEIDPAAPLSLACINGLLYALRIESRVVSKAVAILPLRNFMRTWSPNLSLPTLGSYWEPESRQVTLELEGDPSVAGQSVPAVLYDRYAGHEWQRAIDRFVDDFLQRALASPVEVSLYDQVFRMAQASTPEVVEVPSSVSAGGGAAAAAGTSSASAGTATAVSTDGQQPTAAQMEQWGVCSICAKELKALSSLFDHEMRHLGCNKFSCGEHDFVFHDRKSYRAHMEEFHAGQKLADEDSDFEAEDDMERLRQAVDPHQCARCKDYFPYGQALDRHTQVCDGESFQTRTPLNRGLAGQRNNPYMAVCGLCGYSLSSSDRLKRHFISMHLQCAVCQVTADTLEAMSQHCKSHAEIGASATAGSRKILNCELCGDFHGTKHNFYSHQWTEHGVVPANPKSEAADGDKHRKRRSKVVIPKDDLSYQATGNKKFNCKICSIEVRVTGQEYTKHLAHKHGLTVDANNICRVCGELCENTDRLSEHLKDAHVSEGKYVNAGIQTIFQCEACPFWGFLRAVMEHSRDVHKDNNPSVYQCHHCRERFSDRKLWRVHLDKHNLTMSHQCDYCDKTFRMRTSLLQHVRNHHASTGEDDPVTCEYCGQQYPKHAALKAHIFRMHSVEGQEMKYQCEVCERRFRLEPELRRHVKEMHSGQIECDICGKECPNLRCYSQHRQKHFRTKIFQCTDCQATFKSKMAMKRHIRVEHLNLGPERYECQICGKVVTQIAMHMLTHKEAKYECETCGKRFTKSTYYNEHVRIHKGEKPFMCHLCGRRFNKKSNLNVHVRFHEKHKDKDGNYLELKNQNRSTYPTIVYQSGSGAATCDAITDTHDDADARAILGLESGLSCDTADLAAFADDPVAAAAAVGLRVIAARPGQFVSGGGDAGEPVFKKPKIEPKQAAAAAAASSNSAVIDHE